MNRSLCLSLSSLSVVTVLAGCPSDSGSDTTGTTSTTSTETTATPTTESTDPTTTTDATTTDATTTTEPGTETTAADSTSSTTEAADSTTTAADTTGDDTTTGGAVLPDIDMTEVYDLTVDSLQFDDQNFPLQSCAVQLGCLGAAGQRRLLRFSTITPNIADVAFRVGNPQENPELFIESPCGGGFLFNNYAHYSLVDDMDNEVGHGFKNAFALIDLQQWHDDAGPPHYGFGQDMGISAGWADIYDASLDCQWVDITDVPPGSYTLRISINPEQVVEEASFDNNLLEIPVVIE